MAYVENEQREIENRRKRAGLSIDVDVEARNKLVEEVGEKWEEEEKEACLLIERHIDPIERVFRDAENVYSSYEVIGESLENEKFVKKLKDYLGVAEAVDKQTIRPEIGRQIVNTTYKTIYKNIEFLEATDNNRPILIKITGWPEKTETTF